MHRLESEFADRIDFFVLDVDRPESRTYFEAYSIRSRSTYVLLDGSGQEVRRWVGRLSETAMMEELTSLLVELE